MCVLIVVCDDYCVFGIEFYDDLFRRGFRKVEYSRGVVRGWCICMYVCECCEFFFGCEYDVGIF